MLRLSRMRAAGTLLPTSPCPHLLSRQFCPSTNSLTPSQRNSFSSLFSLQSSSFLPSSRFSLPLLLRVASFASKAGDQSSKSKKGKQQEKKDEKQSAANDAAPSTSSSASAPVKVEGASSPATTTTISRAGMQKLSAALSSSPPSSTAPSPSSSKRASASSPRSSPAPSSPPPSSLRVPLLPGSDVIDPAIAAIVRRSSLDDLMTEQLIDTPKKLVATPTELAEILLHEKQQEQQNRASKRRFLRSRTSGESVDKWAGEEKEYVYEIDEFNENEQIIPNNPESMRRQKAIDLKQAKLKLRERLMDLEDAQEQQKDRQFREAEAERERMKERMRRMEAGEEEVRDLNEDHYDSTRRIREEEAEEALAAARLRENLVFKYREEYGEREGDDYEFEEEEQFYEADDKPPPPVPKKENLKAAVRPREIDKRGRAHGKGGRKTARAQVWIQPGDGECKVNGVNHALYFERFADRACLLRPFEVTDRQGQFNVAAWVEGGGKSGQSGAIQLGIARALAKYEPLLRERLKEEGYLTRDARRVERKKPGQPKARKKYTFVKR